MEKEFFYKVIDDFKNRNICVIGDIMLDKYISGNVNRISPEAPVPVVEVSNEYVTLGGAANVVNNLRALGANALLFSVIGKDNSGKRIKELLKEINVKSNFLITDTLRKTTCKIRIVSGNHQIVRVDYEIAEPISNKIADELINNFKDNIDKFDAVIISDYNKGVITPYLLSNIIKLCRDNGIFIAVDPKQNNMGVYSGANVITPNQKEAGLPFGKNLLYWDDLVFVIKEIKNRYKFDAVLITRGEHGMMLYDDKNELYEIPSVAREVYDVSGAGDTVISTFVLGMASSCSFYEAAILANLAAGIVVGKSGTATITPFELLESLERIGDFNEF